MIDYSDSGLVKRIANLLLSCYDLVITRLIITDSIQIGYCPAGFANKIFHCLS